MNGNSNGHGTVRVVAQFRAHQLAKRGGCFPGRREQDQRERDLGGNQDGVRPRAVRAARGPAGTLLHHLREIGPRKARCWPDTEQHAGEQRHNHRENQNW